MKLRTMLLTVSVLVLLLLAVLPVHAEESGTCGAELHWNYDETTCTLTISGTGKMDDFASRSTSTNAAPWVQYRSSIKTLVIQDGVTYLGNYAFFDCTALTQVQIASSVTELGNEIFTNCTSLRKVTLPDSIAKIGSSVFSGCTALEDVTWSANLSAIPSRTFEDCKLLSQFTIPSAVTEIGYGVFMNSGLKELTIDEGLTTITEGAFAECGNLRQIMLPKTVTYFGRSVFSGCNELMNVVFLGDAPQFALNSFFGMTVTIYYQEGNETWAQVDTEMLEGTVFLCPTKDPASVTVPKDGEPVRGVCGANAYWELNNGVLTISGSGPMEGAMWSNYRENITKVIIEDGITSIASSAFYQCVNLKEVTIPESVTTVESSAFRYCSSLKQIKLPSGITHIDSYTFEDCTALESIVIPDGVTEIGWSAFNRCTSLRSVTLSSALQKIDQGAFADCTSLKSITFPASLQSIGDYAFIRCSSLRTLYFEGDVPQVKGFTFSNVTAIAYYPVGNETWENGGLPYVGGDVRDQPYYKDDFGDCGENLRWEFKDNVLTISGTGEMTTYDKSKMPPWEKYQEVVTKVVIEDGVTSLSHKAFLNFTKLKTVEIADSVTVIGGQAFMRCTALTEIKLPQNLKTIGPIAFGECTSLRSIFIPSSVTTIDNRAFFNCTGLQEIRLCCDAQMPYLIFDGVTATAYYVEGNLTWTEQVRADCGGTITWIATKCIEGHDYGQWQQTKAPTVEETGLEEQVCTKCGDVQQRVLDKLEATAPDVTEPVETEPVETDPAVTDPTEPKETDPTEPSVTEPEETDPTVPETTDPPANEREEQDDDSASWVLPVVCCVIVAVAAGIAVVVIRKKKKA